jgi:hypothetical protein
MRTKVQMMLAAATAAAVAPVLVPAAANAMAPTVTYHVTIKTSNDDNSGIDRKSDCVLSMRIQGVFGETGRMELTTKGDFGRGDTAFSVERDDYVGSMRAVRLKLDAKTERKCTWKPEYISIVNTANGERAYFTTDRGLKAEKGHADTLDIDRR